MIKNKIFKSVRVKLFLTLCVVILMIIFFFIIINNTVLETLYYYSKKESSLDVYSYINKNIAKEIDESEKEKYNLELEKIAVNNSFEILILNGEETVYATNKNFVSEFGTINDITYEVKYSIFNKSDIMYSDGNVSIRKIVDKKNDINYILLKKET